MIEATEHYVVIQAGQYWQALKAIGENIRKGDALLIISVRDVDNAPHTVILRPHPRWYAANPNCDTEHRFLTQDFLSKFEPCPDYKRIRNAELEEIQGRVTVLQHQLAEVNSNPDVMKDYVESGLRNWEKEQKLLPGTASTLPPPIPNATLDASLTTEKIETMKLSMAKAQQVATLQADYIKEKVEKIAKTVQAMTPFYQEQAAAALATTEDVQAHVAKLMTGIESLDLYVGKNVYVEQVSKGREAAPGLDGEPAPLTIMQRKLYMDEELSAWADVEEKFDFESTDKFFQTLRKYKSLVDQIFPTERCIVCMAVTHRERDYGNAWETLIKNEKNKTVFLLIRNGENIHVVYSPVESHMKSPKLFPSAKDIDDIFRANKWFGEKEGRVITFNDIEYTDKLSEHEKVAVHYKRFLILLAGLDHRENLFGTFYDEPKGMRFISQLFQQKYMRFIYDADGSDKMLPGENRPSFEAWAQTKNAYLQSGSRVICLWRRVMTTATAPGVVKYSSRAGDYRDRWMADPIHSYDVKIAFREGKNILVKCPVKREVWGRGRYVDSHTQKFEAKVNLTQYTERYDVGYICLDAVKPEELEWYIHDRENRRGFLGYIRLFKFAIKHLREEQKQETVTRAKLAKALDDGKVATPEEASKAIDTAVIAWRAAHRGEPLTSADDPVEFPKLLNQIWTVLQNLKPADSDWERAEEWAKAQGLTPLRLVQSGKAQTIALYCAPKPEEEDNRLWPMAWVHRIALSRQKGGFKEQNRRWAVLLAVNAAETTLHEWEGVATWADRYTPVRKFEDKKAAFDQIANFETSSVFLRLMAEETWDSAYLSWRLLRSKMMSKVKGRVVNPHCFIPFGLILKNGKVKYLAIGTYDAARLLYLNAPDDTRREVLLKEYSDWYRAKQIAIDRLTGKEGDYDYTRDLGVYEFSLEEKFDEYSMCDFSASALDSRSIKLTGKSKIIFDPAKAIKGILAEDKKYHRNSKFWVPGVREDNEKDNQIDD